MKPVFVVDIGSHSLKAGFHTDSQPISIPTIISESEFVGNEALKAVHEKKEEIRTPFVSGTVGKENWSDMEIILNHVFDQFDESRYGPVIFTEPFFCEKEYSRNLVSLCLEELDVPSFYSFPAPFLAMFAQTKDTGVMMDIGHSFTQSFVFRNRMVKWRTLQKQFFGGKDLNFKILGETDITLKQLAKGLSLKEKNIKSFLDKFALKISDNPQSNIVSPAFIEAEKIKLLYCKIPEKDMKKEVLRPSFVAEDLGDLEFAEKVYKCPDGTELVISPALEETISESLYFGNNGDRNRNIFSIDRQIVESVRNYYFGSGVKKDLGIKGRLYSNIILSGGTSNLVGLRERLQYEIQHVLGKSKTEAGKARVFCNENSQESAFFGGKVVAGIEKTRNGMILREDYEEQGFEKIYQTKKLLDIPLYGD